MEDDPKNVRWRVICEQCDDWKLEGLDTRAEAIAEGHDHVAQCAASVDDYQFRVQMVKTP